MCTVTVRGTASRILFMCYQAGALQFLIQGIPAVAALFQMSVHGSAVKKKVDRRFKRPTYDTNRGPVAEQEERRRIFFFAVRAGELP
jgi:hypothetical protein